MMDATYLTLLGELWGVYCEYFRGYLSCYNFTPLCKDNSSGYTIFPLAQVNNSPETNQIKSDLYFTDWWYKSQPVKVTKCFPYNRADSRLAPTNERRRYKVMPSLIGWAQT